MDSSSHLIRRQRRSNATSGGLAVKQPTHTAAHTSRTELSDSSSTSMGGIRVVQPFTCKHRHHRQTDGQTAVKTEQGKHRTSPLRTRVHVCEVKIESLGVAVLFGRALVKQGCEKQNCETQNCEKQGCEAGLRNRAVKQTREKLAVRS